MVTRVCGSDGLILPPAVLDQHRITAVAQALRRHGQGILVLNLQPPRPLLFTALVLLALFIADARSRRSASAADSLDRLWLDIRDTFGVLWSLRVMDPVNRTLLPESLELAWLGSRVRGEHTAATIPSTFAQRWSSA
jgi:hypothetical protein